MEHNSPAIKNNHIGILKFWGFKNEYSFHNFEKGVVEPVTDLSEINIISKEEFHKIYEERNIKEGTKREKEYGKVHETQLKLMGEGTTDKTGKWSMDFARQLGIFGAFVTMYKELFALYEEKNLEILKSKPAYKAIAMKNLLRMDCESHNISEKVFDETITEKEILQIVGQYNSLPKDWNDKFFSDKNKPSEESIHYLAIAKKLPIKLKKTSDKKQNSILKAEENFIKNITAKKLKFETHGHMPYGDVYFKLKNEIEFRDKDGDSSDIKKAVQLIGKKNTIDSQCYLCGARMGYVVKDANTLEFFSYTYAGRYGGERTESFDTCELADKKKQTHTFELTFPTGKVMLDNFFLDSSKEREYLFEVPKDEKWDDKYTLQTLRGRFNRQDYISKTHNSGYAQMGNMSVDVFVSKDKKKIVIGSEPYDRKENEAKSNKEFNEKFESEYKNIGHISLDVWRWECADKKVLLDKGHSGEAEVTAKVIPGVYTVAHHYDNTGFKENNNRYVIYSEITLKEK